MCAAAVPATHQSCLQLFVVCFILEGRPECLVLPQASVVLRINEEVLYVLNTILFETFIRRIM